MQARISFGPGQSWPECAEQVCVLVPSCWYKHTDLLWDKQYLPVSQVEMCGHVAYRYAGLVPTLPRSIYPAAYVIGGGQPASVFLSFYNLGPQTAETEAAFQALMAYAVPR